VPVTPASRKFCLCGESGLKYGPARIGGVSASSAQAGVAATSVLPVHPIFSSREGTPLGHRNVTGRGFEPARDLAGLPSHLTLHDLRHAAASRLIRCGLDPVTVANVLGHEDANVTLGVYGHLWDRERTDEAVRIALADDTA
jgi:integrase